MGSNSIRLLVYVTFTRRTNNSKIEKFAIVGNQCEMTGLASYIEEGNLSEQGIQRAISAIERHLAYAEKRSCKRTDVFATAALRNAKNRAQAVRAIEKEAGVKVRVLSGEEEAHLGFVGATMERRNARRDQLAQLPKNFLENGTLIDVGGGSTELTCLKNNVDTAHVSVSSGSLSLFNAFVAGTTPTADEMDDISAAFSANLKRTLDPAQFASHKLYGMGGSVRMAAKLVARMNGTETSRVLKKTAIEQALSLCRTNPSAFEHLVRSVYAQRVYTIAPGMIVISAAMELLGADTLTICKYGVREGYLAERMLHLK